MNVLLPVHGAARGLAMVPIALLFGAMFYWLLRVRSRRALPVRLT